MIGIKNHTLESDGEVVTSRTYACTDQNGINVKEQSASQPQGIPADTDARAKMRPQSPTDKAR
jgi:hypothetical protein